MDDNASSFNSRVRFYANSQNGYVEADIVGTLLTRADAIIYRNALASFLGIPVENVEVTITETTSWGAYNADATLGISATVAEPPNPEDVVMTHLVALEAWLNDMPDDEADAVREAIVEGAMLNKIAEALGVGIDDLEESR